MFEIGLTLFSTAAWGGLWLMNETRSSDGDRAEAARHRRYLRLLLGGCAVAGCALIWLPRLCGF